MYYSRVITPDETVIETTFFKGKQHWELMTTIDFIAKENMMTTITTAIKNSTFVFPNGTLITNIKTKDNEKIEHPELLELPIAVTILAATHQIRETQNKCDNGELMLSGEIVDNEETLSTLYE